MCHGDGSFVTLCHPGSPRRGPTWFAACGTAEAHVEIRADFFNPTLRGRASTARRRMWGPWPPPTKLRRRRRISTVVIHGCFAGNRAWQVTPLLMRHRTYALSAPKNGTLRLEIVLDTLSVSQLEELDKASGLEVNCTPWRAGRRPGRHGGRLQRETGLGEGQLSERPLAHVMTHVGPLRGPESSGAAIHRPHASPTHAPWGSNQFKAAGLAQLFELQGATRPSFLR